MSDVHRPSCALLKGKACDCREPIPVGEDGFVQLDVTLVLTPTAFQRMMSMQWDENWKPLAFKFNHPYHGVALIPVQRIDGWQS